MKDSDVEVIAGESEQDKVVCWRFEVLLDAGFPAGEAELIAESSADLHLAESLVARGCSPALAARILL